MTLLRRLRRPGLAHAVTLVVGLVLLSALWWAPGSAVAVTATNASGYPRDVVTVDLRNEQFHQPAGIWYIHAPPRTTFAAVPESNNPPGTLPFSCPLVTSTEARCGGGFAAWAANNTVRARFLIAADAAGQLSGSSSLAGERTAAFTVTVLRPPVPGLQVDAVTTDRTPSISGTKRAGNSVTVTAAGQRACTVAADEGTTWSCTPADSLGPGRVELRATQISPGGDTSDPATQSITVVDPLAITAPSDGHRTTDRTPTVSGHGPLPNALVTVNVGGQSLSGTANSAGNWSVRPDRLGFGRHIIDAASTVAGRALSAGPRTLIVAPKAPPIRQPADGSSTYARTVRIRGTAEPGASVTVTIDGRTSTATAAGDGSWVTAVRNLRYGRYLATARQRVNATESDPTAARVRLLRLGAPTISTPADGTSTTNRTPTFTGTAVPRATVTLRVVDQILRATANAAGLWTVRPATALPLGRQPVTLTQTIDGTASPQLTSSLVVTVIPAPPAPSSPPSTSPSPSVNAPPRRQTPSQPSGSTSTTGKVASGSSPNGGVPAPPAPTAAPTSPPSQPSAAPTPSSSGPASTPQTSRPSGSASGSSSQAGSTAARNDYFPVSLRFPGPAIVPGRVAALTGQLGPNASDKPVTITISGTLNKGVRYRSVDSNPAGACQVATSQFACSIPLQPGQSAVLSIRVLADASNTPSVARQQLTVGSSDAKQPNTFTQVTQIDHGPTDTQRLANEISSGPGPVVVLLSIFLMALAATAARRTSDS